MRCEPSGECLGPPFGLSLGGWNACRTLQDNIMLNNKRSQLSRVNHDPSPVCRLGAVRRRAAGPAQRHRAGGQRAFVFRRGGARGRRGGRTRRRQHGRRFAACACGGAGRHRASSHDSSNLSFWELQLLKEFGGLRKSTRKPTRCWQPPPVENATRSDQPSARVLSFC